MLTKEEILLFLKENKDHIQEAYSIRKIGLFGPFALGQNKAGSDVDLLILFREGARHLYERKLAFRSFLRNL